MCKLPSLLGFFFVLIAFPAASHDLKTIGEGFCLDVIDSVSPGSNHVADCLAELEKLLKEPLDQNGLINALCLAAPAFSYSIGKITTKECLEQAKQGEYLSIFFD